VAKKNSYPDEKTIFKKTINFHQDTLDAVMSWKEKYYRGWSKKTISQQNKALVDLIERLSESEGKFPPKVTGLNYYAYIPVLRTIVTNLFKPSIISTLHELAHHVHGPSEVQACRWSVQLFKKAFPSSYENLQWKGHQLVQKRT